MSFLFVFLHVSFFLKWHLWWPVPTMASSDSQLLIFMLLFPVTLNEAELCDRRTLSRTFEARVWRAMKHLPCCILDCLLRGSNHVIRIGPCQWGTEAAQPTASQPASCS